MCVYVCLCVSFEFLSAKYSSRRTRVQSQNEQNNNKKRIQQKKKKTQNIFTTDGWKISTNWINTNVYDGQSHQFAVVVHDDGCDDGDNWTNTFDF